MNLEEAVKIVRKRWNLIGLCPFIYLFPEAVQKLLRSGLHLEVKGRKKIAKSWNPMVPDASITKFW